MEKDRKLVYFTGGNYRGDLAKDPLDKIGIPAMVLKHKDSTCTVFGNIEVSFCKADEEKALKILEHIKSATS